MSRALVLLGIGLVLSAACRRDAAPNDRKPSPRPSSAGSSSASRLADAPITLLERNESAYGTALFVEGSTVLVLTPTALIRVTEGAPPQKTDVPIGAGAALMGDSIVYFHDRAAHAMAKNGSEPQRLGLIAHAPQRFLASDKRLAWLERADDGSFSLSTFEGKTPRLLYRTPAQVATATMLGDWVFFVERPTDDSWRIGGVSTRGEARAYSGVRTGRAPSMLVPASDGLYFYDGPTRSVRRTAPGLKAETVLAENVICSPLAVSDRILCGHVEGVFEIPGKGRAPRVLARESAGPIAAIAADDKRVVWVLDLAENRLAVRSVPLPPL